MGIADLLVNQNVHPVFILKIMVSLLPRVMIISMPAACLFCVLLAFIRLSSDNEIIALHSSGISLYQMMAPVIFFSLASTIIAGLVSIYGVPIGNRSYRDVVYKMIKSNRDLTIKERTFYEPIDNLMFYINHYAYKEKLMKDLFVVDRRDRLATSEIIADRGWILSGGESNILTVRFEDGIIFTIEKDRGTARTIQFESYDLNIDLRDILSGILSREKEPKEMFIGELLENLQKGPPMKRHLIGITLFEMFSIPVAIFLLGIIGAPLGIQVRTAGRTKGMVISLFLFLAYYNLLMGASYICEKGFLLPSVGVWIPNLFLLLVSVYLFVPWKTKRPLSPV